MNKTDKDPSYLNDQNFLDLVAFYIEHPIALYTGAGVSWSDNPKLRVGLWDDLIKNILLSAKNLDSGTIKEFESLDWKDKPWEMAEWVANKIGHDEFKQYVTALIQKEGIYQKKYKLLSGKFLESAKTLNAIVAFCAAFAGGKITKGKNGQWLAVYQRSINHRVHTVVTSNYDPFLEAASSTMFRKPILKPVAAQGSSVGTLNDIPVFHIHGYIRFPYESRKQDEIERKPFVDLVITTSDYKLAWRSQSAYNPTMGPQIHILRHYSVLFIGFSFRDWEVNNLLKNLNKERSERRDRLYHYAIMKKDDIDAKGIDYFQNELGVKPIAIDDYFQIKNLLSHLYQQALVYDHQKSTKIKLAFYEGKTNSKEDKPVYLAPSEYFEELYKCRLSMVRRKKRNT